MKPPVAPPFGGSTGKNDPGSHGILKMSKRIEAGLWLITPGLSNHFGDISWNLPLEIGGLVFGACPFLYHRFVDSSWQWVKNMHPQWSPAVQFLSDVRIPISTAAPETRGPQKSRGPRRRWRLSSWRASGTSTPSASASSAPDSKPGARSARWRGARGDASGSTAVFF